MFDFGQFFVGSSNFILQNVVFEHQFVVVPGDSIHFGSVKEVREEQVDDRGKDKTDQDLP